MLKTLIHRLLLFVLSLRYRVTIIGLDAVREKGNKSILFMPNHPALIDPVIMMSRLFRDFAPRPLADEAQIDKTLLRPLMKTINAVVIPDLQTKGNQGRKTVIEGVEKIITGLKQGDNILLYPAGKLCRSRHESIGANSSVALVLKRVPDVRIVLIRTTGLWGSSFSRACGPVSLTKNIRLYCLALASAGLFFMPKRQVIVEFVEQHTFPRTADKLRINRYLEDFYNEVDQYNTKIPYFWWQGREAKQVPEPVRVSIDDDTSHIPAATKELVLEKLRELSGVKVINEKDTLANDLGMDSLVMVEYSSWLELEFGVSLSTLESIQNVAHCILAAAGELSSPEDAEEIVVDERWFTGKNNDPLIMPQGENVTSLFLAKAKENPAKVIVADQISGPKTYRQLITGIFALRPMISSLSETNVGIMLPATVSAALSYFTVLFSGKVPVMVNWTVGQANMSYCLNNANVKHVITAKVLYEKIKGQGVDLDKLDVKFLFLEEMAAGITLPAKLKALFMARFSLQSLEQVELEETAAILFTSGSEARPKAVALSHANFLANIADYTAVLTLTKNDSLLGMLPPFHSLGLTGTVLMPIVMGLPTVYSPNPTEGALLAKIVLGYKVSLLIGTPTFLAGIAKAVGEEKLNTVRIAFTGAEKCQPYVYEALEKSFPEVIICEGYGVTECSPLVSVNDPNSPVPGSIGRVLPSMEYALVHAETGIQVKEGEIGKLLLRGPNVFNGYLNYNGKSPFVEYQGKKWYDSGDLVVEHDGILTFAGRLKRFIKLGGEMISLPAIEEILTAKFPGEEEPILAVSATPGDDHPEIVLFITFDLEREEANRIIREFGFSALHSIRRTIRVETIPVLGTGKIDYLALEP
jgi:long-chain-fatty-acid--[acyl-carrier-protein] ligase